MQYLPILHLNGYKIANPTVPARISRDELVALLTGYGHDVLTVEGNEPDDVHQQLAVALDTAHDAIQEIWRAAREDGDLERRPWPMILLVTPKGWTGPREVDGLPVEGTWRAHQVPLAATRENSGRRPAAAGLAPVVPTPGVVQTTTVSRSRQSRSPGASTVTAG